VTRAGLTDGRLLGLAIAMWGAALLGRTVDLDLGSRVPIMGTQLDPVRMGIACAGAVAWRHRRALAVATVLVLFTLMQSSASWQELRAPVIEEPHVGEALLRTDPTPVSGGVRMRLEVDGRIFDARAWGSPAGWLRPRLMGERLQLEATLRPLTSAPAWLQAQGVAGRATVKSVGGFTEGRTHTRVANSVRRTIEEGARSMSRDDRALFTGLVFGDDRRQSPLTADNFAGAGLTHLLAVSGQNVAFLLAIAGPALRRLGHRRRLIAVAMILLVFATMTRFEASVLRASTMAAIAAMGALIGTAVPAQRVLTLTVVTLLAVNPLLVHSVAFQLSLAASAGILFWSARVARALPGPRPLVEALAVTSTAQFAVAPVLLWRFGPLPVASLPANVLAGPAAGPVMMWGMTGGWVAGLVPERVAEVLHLPTRALVAWIDGVAQWCAALPLGQLGAVPLAACGLAAWLGLRSSTDRSRHRCLAAIVVVLVLPALVGWAQPAASGPIPGGLLLRDDATTVAVLHDARNPEDVLAALRSERVGRVDLLVASSASFAMADLLGWIDDRHGIGEIWAPEATMGRSEIVPGPLRRVHVGGLALAPNFEGDELTLGPAIEE
jgi:competence protein ComEC